MLVRYSHSKTDTYNQIISLKKQDLYTMSEQTYITPNLPSNSSEQLAADQLDIMPTYEQIDARHDVDDALAGNITPTQEKTVPARVEVQPMVELLPHQLLGKIGVNLASVRRAAQADFDLAA
jgi:hypothetical protein